MNAKKSLYQIIGPSNFLSMQAMDFAYEKNAVIFSAYSEHHQKRVVVRVAKGKKIRIVLRGEDGKKIFESSISSERNIASRIQKILGEGE